MTVGIGRVSLRIQDLPLSCKEALTALVYGLMVEGSQIIHIDDIILPQQQVEFPQVDNIRLSAMVMAGDKKGISYMLSDIFRQIALSDSGAVNKIKTYVMEFINLFLESAAQAGYESISFEQMAEYYSCLINLNSLEDIYQWLKNVVESVLEALISRRTGRNRKTIIKAKNYININYSRDLNLDEVAESVFLSPNYFGWLFKKEMKMTFIEYLTKVRLNNAKRLLEKTQDSIQIISEKVGFNDPNYFSQVFLKYFAIRPTDYRKSKREIIVKE